MKIIALAVAGLVAATTLTSVPAQAQRHGYDYNNGYDRGWRGDYRRGDRGWDNRRGWDNWRGWDNRRGWDDRRDWNRGWRGDRGGGWGRDRSRVRCTWVRSYYGPQRQCYRVWR